MGWKSKLKKAVSSVTKPVASAVQGTVGAVTDPVASVFNGEGSNVLNTITLGTSGLIKDGDVGSFAAGHLGGMAGVVGYNAVKSAKNASSQSAGDVVAPPVIADVQADNQDTALLAAQERARLLAAGRSATMSAGETFGLSRNWRTVKKLGA